MQQNDDEKRADLFRRSTEISESKPWVVSLPEQLRSIRTPRNSVEISAAPIEVPEIWSKHKAALPRLLSLLTHLTALLLVLIPVTPGAKPLPKGIINVALYAPTTLVRPSSDDGGGGGGRRALTPPSLGKPPKASDKQLVPPDPEPPRNPDPTLVVEPSVIAPELEVLPTLTLLTFGDPEGIPGPPSPGSGTGYGIGGGDGHGIGEGRGPGLGFGENGGRGDRPFSIREGVSAPVLVSQILPEYSEAARKARFQGNVVIETIVRADGSVEVVRVARGVGFGLDQNAVEAVLKWKFRPGRKNGVAVAVALNVEVRFNLR